jgi:NADPH-dependent curcumin reductase CurA
MAPTQAKQWLLTKRPSGLPTYGTGDDTDLKLVTVDLPAVGDKQVLLKSKYFSNDPAQRGWMDDIEKLYVEPVKLGTPMRTRGIGEVIESKSDKFKAGDLVQAPLNWTDYSVHDESAVTQLPPLPEGLNISHYLGAFGGTGLTAYYGLVVIGEAKAGQKIVVSGAAGATGSMVVQIAKHIVGAKEVIGMAGSDDKCRWVESLGAGTSFDLD